MKSQFLCKGKQCIAIKQTKQISNENQVINVKQLIKHKLKIANCKALN